MGENSILNKFFPFFARYALTNGGKIYKIDYVRI